MFAYCNNNPVNFVDPSGTSGHNAAQPWLCECPKCNTSSNKQQKSNILTTISNHYAKQKELELIIMMQQNMLIQQSAEALWDAHVHNVELQGKAQWDRDQEIVKIGTAFKEDPLLAVDAAAATIGFGSWYVDVLAVSGVVSIPGVGQAALLTISGIAALWSIGRVVQIVIDYIT